MSNKAHELLKQWKRADPTLRADAIEYLRGLRTGVPVLAAELLGELAYAFPFRTTEPYYEAPDGPIPNGAHRSVRGSKGFYTVCNHGGRLFCDCPSFAFSKEPQTCKHVRGLEPAQYGKKG